MFSRSSSALWLLTGGILITAFVAVPIVLSVVFGLLYQQANNDLKNCRQSLPSTTPSTPFNTTFLLPTTSVPPKNLTLRLPTNVIPIHYQLSLQIFLPFNQTEEDTPNTFRTVGTVDITIKPLENNVDRITLHARTQAPPGSGKLSFSASQVQLVNGANRVPIDRVECEPESDIFVVFLKERLSNGAEYILTVRDYEGVIASDNEGLYRSSFVRDGVRNWLAVAKFQPHKARRMLPCFDEPGFRSTFDVVVKHDSRFTTVRSNGIAGVVSNSTVGNGWAESRFSRTPSMPVYLLTILVSTFGQRTTYALLDRYKPISILGVEEMLVKHDVTFSMQESVKALRWMDDKFQQPYFDILPKLDQAALPDFPAGATEDWGLILYREANLLYEPGVSSADNKRSIAAVIAHELSHMVFGNLLTCKWWSDTWLNEGFARFLQYEILHDTKPEWKLDPLVPYWTTQVAMQLDAYDTAHPLYNPNVVTISQIENMFGSLSYAKGGSVVRMIRGVMGDVAFYSALRKYVAKFKLQNVVHEDLLTILSEELITDGGNDTMDFSSHMATWIEKNGYPVITLNRTGPEANDITYEQKRFLLRTGNSSTDSTVDKTRVWHIPLSMAPGERSTSSENPIGGFTNGRRYKTCWVTKASGRLSTECSSNQLDYPSRPPSVVDATSTNFIIANPGQYGMYRVNYDRQNWRRIAAQLNNDLDGFSFIDEVNRAQVIDDSFNLAKTGDFEITYEVVFDLIRYLSRETQYGPFAAAMDNMRYLDQMLRSTLDHRHLLRYMRNLFDLKYPAVASSLWSSSVWSDDNEGGYTTLLYNNAVLENACYFEQPECLRDAARKFEQWRRVNQSLSLPYEYPTENSFFVTNFPQTRNMILCYGIRASENPVADWLFLNDMHDAETIPTARSSILRALACSKDTLLLQRLLQKTLDGTVREQDRNSIFSYLSRWHLGEQLAWSFLRDNWNRLSRRSSIIADVTASFNTRQQLEQLKEFQASLGASISEGPAFERAIDKILANIEWMEESADDVVNQLVLRNNDRLLRVM